MNGVRKLACGFVGLAATLAAVRSDASPFLDGLAANANKIAASDYASGGDIIWRIGNDYIHIFTNTAASAAFTPAEAMSVRVLMVGGGGSGGSDVGGGGGAGGMVETNGLELVANTAYTITVGAGGAFINGTASAGNSGGDSSMLLSSDPVVETAKGGGGGGAYGGRSAKFGGSGGGASQNSTNGASGTAGQGNKGGNYSTYAGGGGGAGGNGGNGSSGGGGAGGAGLASDILTYSVTFAGGGGGGTTSGKSTQAAGGTGGGGTGGYSVANTRTSTPGEDGLGAGGGGAGGGGIGNVPKYGAAGGSGIVIIRYHRVPDGEKDIVLDPQVISGLVYDGTVQTGVVAGAGYTLTGDTATSAGQHVAVATLTDPDTTEWPDHTTAPKNVEWSIAQAGNEWTTAPALSKTWWMNEHDTPATVTTPVAKFGAVVATLNDAAWDGSALPTEAGDYAAVWTVAATTDYTGLCATNRFTVSNYIAPENRAARYSADGVDWTGADSFAAAVAAAPDGGIVELNENISLSAQVTIGKSLTIRSCSAKDGRFELTYANTTSRMLNIDASGKHVVLSNLVVNGNGKGTDTVWLQAGTLTLGRDLVLSKGSATNGRVLSVGGASAVLNLDGVTIENSSGNWGLIMTSQAATINLFDCTVTNTRGANNPNSFEGSVLHINNQNAVLNVYGGTITNNKTKATYGQVYSTGKVYFKGGNPVIEDLGVSNATRIQLDGTLDKDASVGVLYGAPEGDAFGQYVSGDSASARAFYLSAEPKLKGCKRGANLVWGSSMGLCIILK